MQLKNKIVVITGSSSGIGQATAYAFAKEDAVTGEIHRVDGGFGLK